MFRLLLSAMHLILPDQFAALERTEAMLFIDDDEGEMFELNGFLN